MWEHVDVKCRQWECDPVPDRCKQIPSCRAQEVLHQPFNQKLSRCVGVARLWGVGVLPKLTYGSHQACGFECQFQGNTSLILI